MKSGKRLIAIMSFVAQLPLIVWQLELKFDTSGG